MNDILYDVQRKAILEEVKKNDCIIIGRCGGEIVRKYTRTKNVYVFIAAKLETKISRLLQEKGFKDEDEAKKAIAKRERQRQKYFKYYTGKDWKDFDTYDAVFNCSVLGDERVEALLVKAYEEMKDYQ